MHILIWARIVGGGLCLSYCYMGPYYYYNTYKHTYTSFPLGKSDIPSHLFDIFIHFNYLPAYNSYVRLSNKFFLTKLIQLRITL